MTGCNAIVEYLCAKAPVKKGKIALPALYQLARQVEGGKNKPDCPKAAMKPIALEWRGRGMCCVAREIMMG